MNMKRIKQIGHYKDTIAKLKRELDYKKYRLDWYMAETTALEGKLYTLRRNTTYERIQDLENTNNHLQGKYEKQRQVLVGFIVYSILATIAIITLAI